MDAGHDHTAGARGNERALLVALGLTGGFMLVEAAAGLWFNSLALLSDAAHMSTDAVALAIAVAAVRIARRPADRRRTFGYHRFEVLAAYDGFSLDPADAATERVHWVVRKPDGATAPHRARSRPGAAPDARGPSAGR